jgi:hypothetical protein
MDTNIVEVLKNIKKSTELVFEHYRYFERAKGFKNTLIEIGLENIISMAQDSIDEIEQTKNNKGGIHELPVRNL